MLDIEDFVHRNFDNPSPYGNPMSDYRVLCPFCVDRLGTSDTKGKLHIGLSIEAVHCFRCGYSANWIKFVQDLLECNYADALKELYVVPKIRDNISKTLMEGLEVSVPVKHTLESVKLPEDFEPLIDSTDSNLARKAKKYSIKRGFGKHYWKRYNLGTAESIGWRLIIPIEESYWQARSIISWLKPKYTNPNIPSENFIFNSGALESYEEVVICEGAFNAMAVGENAIAILGKEVPPIKLKRLKESPVRKFVVALDKDALKWTVELANSLTRASKEVVVWNFDNDTDLADGGKFCEVKYDFESRLNLLLE